VAYDFGTLKFLTVTELPLKANIQFSDEPTKVRWQRFTDQR